jgi:hypothetical protein
VSNLDEWVANTRPDLASDFPALDRILVSDTGILIRFQVKPATEYFIEYFNGLPRHDPPWTAAGSNALSFQVEGTGEWLDAGPPATDPHPFDPAVTQRSYRLEIRRPR